MRNAWMAHRVGAGSSRNACLRLPFLPLFDLYQVAPPGGKFAANPSDAC